MLRKDPPTYDLWQFAARYSFLELEKYCRQSRSVRVEISKTILNPTKGIIYLLNVGLPLSLINELICDIFKAPEQAKAIVYTCKECNILITYGIRYRCQVCLYDYCQACYPTVKKAHVPFSYSVANSTHQFEMELAGAGL